MDDCTGTMEQVCGSSPLEASSKGEEPHGAQSWMTAQGQWGAVMDDCTGTKEQLCGSSPFAGSFQRGGAIYLLHCSIGSVQSSMTAPMSHKVTIWLPKEYKRAAWLGSPQLLVDWQEDNTSLPPSLSP